MHILPIAAWRQFQLTVKFDIHINHLFLKNILCGVMLACFLMEL